MPRTDKKSKTLEAGETRQVKIQESPGAMALN
jgi:hypothetical protein